MDHNRDFYSEGFDAAMSGLSGVVPSDVSKCGVDAFNEWNDGYNDAVHEMLNFDDDYRDSESERR